MSKIHAGGAEARCKCLAIAQPTDQAARRKGKCEALAGRNLGKTRVFEERRSRRSGRGPPRAAYPSSDISEALPPAAVVSMDSERSAAKR